MAALADFVAHWQLDEQAQDLLNGLEPDVQQRVMDGFAPKDTSRGSSRAFMAFARNVAAGAPRTSRHESGIDDFVVSWQLDESAQQLLYSLEPEVQRRVMSGFAPKNTTAGASKAFMAFARNVAGGAPRHQHHVNDSGSYNGTLSRGSEVEEFAFSWQLDGPAEQYLYSLEPEVQRRVMSGFSPKDTAAGASRAFMVFARSVNGGTLRNQHHVGDGGSFNGASRSEREVDEFVASWELDGSAQQLLYSLEPDAQRRVMTGFDPRDTTAGASRAFMAFARSVAGVAPGAQSHAVPTVVLPRNDRAVKSFVENWQLDESAQELLYSLDPEDQRRVMSGFAPKDASRGASRVFMGFARSVVGASAQIAGRGVMRMSPQEEFVHHWQLDEHAQQLLFSLDPEAQQRVMDGFAPKDTSRGASKAFMAFARSVVQGMGQAAGHGNAVQTLLDEFAYQWQLDEQAQQLLYSLEYEVQLRVIDAFDPKDISNGASKAFMAFARRVAEGRPQTAGRGVARRRDPLEEFVYAWQLDELAQQLFYSLDTDVQQRVMDGFAPKDMSRGASAAFMGFVRSVSGTSAQGRSPATSPGDFVDRWALDDKAQELFYSLEADVQEKIMRKFHPNDLSRGASVPFMAFARSMAGAQHSAGLAASASQAALTSEDRLVHGDALEDFVERWQLDTKARDMLYNLDPELQQRVMEGFAPKDVSRGASGALTAFARSVAGAAGAAARGVPGKEAASHMASKIQEFIDYWALDTQAQHLLHSLSSELQQRVIDGFAPRDISRGASLPFGSFVRSVAKGKGKGETARYSPY